MQVSSSAPTRIDLAGGTLDIWPLYLLHPGAVTVNVAIGVRATCEISRSDDGGVHVVSSDTGLELHAGDWHELDPRGDGRLLVQIARFFEIRGVRVVTHSGSPMGAGIAGSSALAVAVCAALARWQRRTFPADQLLALAMNLEARALEIPTGVQDYRPALYGGVSAIELGPLGVHRVALEVDHEALQRRLVLAYSGDSRSSGVNNWAITRRHLDGDLDLRRRFDELRDIAVATRQALVAQDWAALAEQLTREWETRQTLAAGVGTPAIDRLLERARAAGAQAGKACGAGGGGCVCLLVDPDRRAEVCAAVLGTGARLLDSRIDLDGLRLEGHPG